MSNSNNPLHSLKHSIDRSARTYKHIAEIEHTGLGVFKILKDQEPRSLDGKINAQFENWDNQWLKQLNLKAAEEKTVDYKDKISDLNNLLIGSLNKPFIIDWSSLIDRNKFVVKNPKSSLPSLIAAIKVPVQATLLELPPAPDKEIFRPKYNILDLLLIRLREKKIKISNELYADAKFKWKNQTSEVKKLNDQRLLDYDKLVSRYNIEIQFTQNINDSNTELWNIEQSKFYGDQSAFNSKLLKIERLYKDKNFQILPDYYDLLLKNSKYPDNFPKEFDFEFRQEERFMILDYVLPSPEDIPQFIEAKYILAKKEIKDIPLSESQLTKMYDDSIYNIILRTINEIFQYDKIDALDTLIINGWVSTHNKGTGLLTNSCITSIQVNKLDFLKIDLAKVNPKVCFKSLKGIGSSTLSGIVAIQPIMLTNLQDKRFVNSYNVASSLNEGVNLASMGWEDFEHLIRELFQQEFSSTGGEVKVTQASHDGGVDAIAFDLDPIRGGKIVIQAKRYTNTVGVSAIRDLYGTVLNEGASKGILVTTSDFGPDSYEFVKNKPLTLLSGSNLLHLLEKHGHKARINIQEAKVFLKDQAN